MLCLTVQDCRQAKWLSDHKQVINKYLQSTLHSRFNSCLVAKYSQALRRTKDAHLRGNWMFNPALPSTQVQIGQQKFVVIIPEDVG